MIKELICINCPIGCHLEVEIAGDEEFIVTGNKCKRGIQYANEELTEPKRVVTATCKINSQIYMRVPVNTENAIPKDKIDALLKTIYAMDLHPPIKMGDILIENIDGTGVALKSSITVES
jgi:CxxC motif-containing protein